MLGPCSGLRRGIDSGSPHTSSPYLLDPSPGLGLSRATQELRRVLFGLVKNKDDYVSVVADIPEPVSWASRHRGWYLPAILAHLWRRRSLGSSGRGTSVWHSRSGSWSHPAVGWLVNSYGHRNFDTVDNSHNSLPVAIATFGAAAT